MQTKKNGGKMMLIADKNRLLIFEIIGALVVSIGAYVFHFLYEWSGENFFIGLISATNESVFEHTKILFFPYLIYSIVEYFFIRVELKRYIVAKSLTAILLFVLVISVFYIYTGIIGHHISYVDMISAFLYVFLAFFISYQLIGSNAEIQRHIVWVVPVVLLILFAEVFFTVYPPQIPLFFDTQDKYYGMIKPT